MATQEIFDLSLDGTISANGEIENYEGVEALQNAIKLFLTSFQADCIRNYGAGGFLTQYLSKPMSNQTAESMRIAIRMGFERMFKPQVNVSEISAIPNQQKRYWEISMKGYCPAIKDNIEVSFFAKSLI